ncbi:hypothetical protein TELCIR_14143, partial [Teladorsagia circumcincta]
LRYNSVAVVVPYKEPVQEERNVRVGHIGAVGYMKNGEKILEISRNQLRKDGVLDEDFDIEWGS